MLAVNYCEVTAEKREKMALACEHELCALAKLCPRVFHQLNAAGAKNRLLGIETWSASNMYR